MKKLLLLLFLLGCTNDTFTVRVSIDPDFIVTKNGVFQLSSIVADFDHVYDSINFVATNLTNNKQTMLSGKQPDFSFAASAANYTLYMATKSPRWIERYAHFSASNPSVAISNTNKAITITSQTEQGLILIVKAGVQTQPTIKVGTTSRLMFDGVKYWYAYVKDDGKGANISTTISGVLIDNIVIGVTKGTVYVFNPVAASIKSSDPFTIIYNL